MSTIIRYTNTNSEPITQQQIQALKIYNKEIYTDDKLKKVEKYGFKDRTKTEIILEGGEYYLDFDEDLENIIEQFASSDQNWFFHCNIQTNLFGDVYSESIQYKNGTIESKRKKVVNSEGLLLAFCTIDLITNEHDDQMKFFYGDINIFNRLDYTEEYLCIQYNNNDVEQIYIGDDNYSMSDFLESNESSIFIWNNQPYYHHFEPMLPNVPIS